MWQMKWEMQMGYDEWGVLLIVKEFEIYFEDNGKLMDYLSWVEGELFQQQCKGWIIRQ